MNWNPSYSYAAIPLELAKVPSYYKVLATPVAAAQGLPHFRNVHIWNVKATDAKQAFNVSAYPDAPLENFCLDHLEIEATTAGTIANAKNWSFENNQIRTDDGSKLVFTDAAKHNSKDIPYGEPK